MSSPILDVSNVINISVIATPTNLGLPNINTAALISKEVPLDFGSDAFRIYTNATDVATDWGTDSDAFAIATTFFAQNPNVLNTGGYLAIVPRLQTPSLETIEAAIVRTVDLVYYFGILVDEAIDESTFGTLTTYVQTLDKLFFYGSSNTADFAPGGILDQLATGGKTHTRGLYYGGAVETAQQFASAYAGRGLSTDFGGSNTTGTMQLKALAGIDADPTMTQTNYAAAKTAGVDVYANVGGVESLLTSGANQYFDEIYNEMALKFALQTAGFNYLRDTSTKIPQTEPGMDGLKNAYRRVCDQFVANGYAGPGEWTSSQVFGNPTSLRTAIEGIGYYVYSQPIALQSTADRADRKAPLVQIAIKAQGAVHSSNVLVFVNI